MCELFMTRDAHRFYEEADPVLARNLNRCFGMSRDDPYRHPNVKRLKGPLAGYLRYRVGDWRVVYEVQEQEERVIVVVIARRSDAYR